MSPRATDRIVSATAYVILVVAIWLSFGSTADTLRDSQVTACATRGNSVRASLRDLSDVLEGSLSAATHDPGTSAIARVTYSSGVGRLQAIVAMNQPVDCDAIIPQTLP